MLPLRKSATTQEQFQDVIDIFCNIETIVRVHKKLLEELLKIRDTNWPFVSGIGQLFLEQAQEFQSYGDYAENFATSKSTLDHIFSSSKKAKTRELFEVLFYYLLFF